METNRTPPELDDYLLMVGRHERFGLAIVILLVIAVASLASLVQSRVQLAACHTTARPAAYHPSRHGS